MYNIVYITDDNYVLPTKASINSIVQNITEAEVCVNVICVEVTEKNQQAIKNLASKNIKINILNFGNEYSDLGLSHIYVSKVALFKFQIPNIFKDLDRILYVDGDMILSKEFTEIFNLDISGKYAAVVQDLMATCFEKWNEKLGHKKYFNSGMMYLNLKKMREDLITEKLIEYKRNDKENHFMDQNALNTVIGENCLWISPKFNMMATCNPDFIRMIYAQEFTAKLIADFYEISESEIQSAWKNPAILHVTSETKAWKNISAARIDEWIRYSLSEDHLKVAKNYCVSLKSDLEKKNDELANQVNQKFFEEENKLKKIESNTTQQISAMKETSAEVEAKISTLEAHLAAQNEIIASQSQQLSAQEQKISDLENRLKQTYNLLINTRHRTLYGAAAWLFRKVFRRK